MRPAWDAGERDSPAADVGMKQDAAMTPRCGCGPAGCFSVTIVQIPVQCRIQFFFQSVIQIFSLFHLTFRVLSCSDEN